MSSQKLVVLLITLTFVLLQLAKAQQCHTPILNSRKNLDLKRFGGIWYRVEYAIFNKPAQPSLVKCDLVNYDVPANAPEGVIIGVAVYKEVGSGVWEIDTANITVPNPQVPGTWKADWKLVDGEPLENVILATDYDNWAYSFACQMQEGGRHEMLNVWSRNRTINPTVLGVVRTLMNGLGFGSSQNVIVDQNNCE